MARCPDITNWLPPPGGGRERVAAIIEAATGRSPLPCHLRAMREQRIRLVADAKAALGIVPARKPRRPTLISVSKQARTAGINIARIEMKPDGTVVVVTGKPEAATPENPWPLDEFSKKETKQ